MQQENPFNAPGGWYKGCLHVHSTLSDGLLSSDEVLDWYRSHGYHFVALTDHHVPSQAEILAEDWITLAGVEVGGLDPVAGLYHLVGLGVELPGPGLSAVTSLQDAVDRLRAAGALVCLAHPYWSGQRSAQLMDVQGCFALEVYNGGCEVDDAKGFSHVHWDDLLAAGRRLWGLAVDDAHWRTGDRDAGLGWVWVKAPALTQQAILEALDRGCFYASSGPLIHDVELDAGRGEIRVRCSPVVSIDFVGSGPLSRRVLAPTGQTLTEASHRLQDVQGYVRVACQDADGRWAWSNPLFLGRNGEDTTTWPM
ncbi:MAG: CehA/McbA family metallohydrolase [Anaerolineae bacterium]|nr:CehA/McbA family metallohydrolase [Anaerolineae bacterium]